MASPETWYEIPRTELQMVLVSDWWPTYDPGEVVRSVPVEKEVIKEAAA